MANTVFSYKIKKEDSYSTISKQLISNDDAYHSRLEDKSLVQQVILGLQYHTGNRKLVAGKSINLIREVDYYLVLKPAQKRSEKLTSGAKEEVDTLNQYNIPTDDLFFNVKIYKDYKCYSWREQPQFKITEKYGALSDSSSSFDFRIHGSKGDVKNPSKWYVYIFEGETIQHVFFAHEGGEEFQEVEIAGETVNYDSYIGKKEPYVVIKDYFAPENKGKTEWRVYVSRIKLSDERVFGKKCKDLKLSKDAGHDISRYIKDYNEEKYKLSGPESLRKYRNDELLPLTYGRIHITTTTFDDNKNGLTLYYPDPLAELNRRGKHFNEKWQAWVNWQEDETHVRESFIYNLVNNIIRKDHGMADYIEKDRLRAWKEEDSEQFRLKNFPVYYGANDLIQWLKSVELTECLKDHLAGSDENQQESAIEYSKAIKNLHKVEAGAKYLNESFDDRFHYLNMGLEINEAFIKENEVLSTFVAIRKWNNFTFNLFSDVVPTFVEKYGSASIAKIINKVKKTYNTSVSIVNIRPLKSSAVMVSVANVDKFADKISSLGTATTIGKSVVNVLEVANLAVSIKVLYESGEENRLANSLAVAGATLDLASENWLFQNCLKNSLGGPVSSRIVPGMQVISGIIDCYLGFTGAVNSYNDKEYGLCIGWGTFALGGALVAAGAAIKLAGTRSMVTSGGTSSKVSIPLIITGIAFEGIGLLMADYYDNRDMKSWLEQCIFGADNKMMKDLLYDEDGAIREGAERHFLKRYGPLDRSLKSIPGYNSFLSDLAAEEYINWNSIYREIGEFVHKDDKGNVLGKYKDTLQPQIDRINYLMCEFEVKAEFSSPSIIFRTQVDVIIEPRMLTPYATIEFTGVKAYAEDGWFEFTDINTQAGTEESSNKVIDMDNMPPGLRLERENGIITKIYVPFVYRMDIDKLIGNIRIKMNDRSLQERTQSFEVESGVFD